MRNTPPVKRIIIYCLIAALVLIISGYLGANGSPFQAESAIIDNFFTKSLAA